MCTQRKKKKYNLVVIVLLWKSKVQHRNIVNDILTMCQMGKRFFRMTTY